MSRHSLPIFSLSFLVLLAVISAPLALAADDDERTQRAEYIRKHYSKHEHQIPMRDGTELWTVVYIPNEIGGGPYPILLLRTPYSVGPYGAERYKRSLGPHFAFEKSKFIFAFQDVRGKYMSQGEFVNMRPHNPSKQGPSDVDEASDTWDTIDWLVKNVPRNNGKVGQWGISYPGFYTAAGMIDSHPALKAASPQAPIADWFWDDMHRHGAFVLNLAFNFFSSFGQPRPEPTTERAERFEHGTADGYQFFLDLGPLSNVNEKHLHGEVAFWNDIVAHPNYDEFWQSRNILPHLKNITAAVMVVGGWFDMEDLYGPLQTYRHVEELNPGAENMLVMGPWRHGGWVRGSGETLGRAEFGYPTAETYREQVDLAFFEYHLKGEGELKLPEALVFETGADRWREMDAWPPTEAERKRLYLHDDGALGWQPPEASAEGALAADTYPSDPAKPVPYTMDITTRWNAHFMTEDQRFAAWRPDVLVYSTEVLEADVTFAGPITADLWVSTTGRDSDFVVKVIDVLPPEHPQAEDDRSKRDLGARQELVRGEVFRGRFRNSYEEPEPFVPGEPTRVTFTLHDVLHTFQRGHRIMVQIQSSWFPLVDRNPQSWVENIFEAEEEDFVKVENTIHRSPDHPSSIEVGILE
ncbi:MAG: CocE/NonD family hydrolase [Holophagales bacterium]|nr:CocE/NonD family hydrolase [Holophagales bacterium]